MEELTALPRPSNWISGGPIHLREEKAMGEGKEGKGGGE